MTFSPQIPSLYNRANVQTLSAHYATSPEVGVCLPMWRGSCKQQHMQFSLRIWVILGVFSSGTQTNKRTVQLKKNVEQVLSSRKASLT